MPLTISEPAPPGQAPPEPTRSTAARHTGIVLVLFAAVVLACLASVLIGAKNVPPGEALRALTGDRSGDALLVAELRFPRTLLGLLVGIALGVAGTLAQELTRNPLGDPGLLGVSAGAALSVAASIGVFGLTSPYQYVWFAFIGAALAGALVYAIGGAARASAHSGGASPVKLALAGAAVTALLMSLTHALVLLDVRTFDQYRFWAVGSLAGRDGALAGQLAPFVLAALVLTAVIVPRMNALALGDELAGSLGVRVGVTRLLGAVAVVLLTGAAVAAAGPVTFVGLVVPHLVRPFTGPDLRWLLPGAGLAGAALLLGADTLGRLLDHPGEVQAGVVTAMIGAPFLIMLVKRGRFREQTR
ncbi:FecCD family ABC transporter permease [Plantactinospora soyae]|uniref:Iron complex transport system permease protein n=1 Tax=Plantactinospora soyae TaxID=1544732 RepID=A0A927QZ65_9ACTN|nr:iron ABC transporter permease [Plantactinospora soyae]MBE1487273.1 iron complex transport system permease protein [Plantactinospora soyae]